MTLKNKTVLVTGASKGIGRACAEAFASNGANVILNYAHDDKPAQELADELSTKYSVKTLVVKADVAIQKDVDEMFLAIQGSFDHLDILVNNAGIIDHDDTAENIEAAKKIFDTNLFGQMRVAKAAHQMMPKGKIIFISSIHGKLGHGRPNVISYSASKAALNSYMKNLAKELAPDILVNAVAPGRTFTPMWGELSGERKAKEASGHLINRWIEPSEIADGVIFLAKNDAVCGEILVIDGGMSLKVLG